MSSQIESPIEYCLLPRKRASDATRPLANVRLASSTPSGSRGLLSLPFDTMSSPDFPLGSTVDVTAGNGGRGVVRFCGATAFAAGKWVGVELNEPKGKNDGTVQGIRYFTCKKNYGVFARPSQVRLVKATPDPRLTASVRLDHLVTTYTRSLRRIAGESTCIKSSKDIKYGTRFYCLSFATRW